MLLESVWDYHFDPQTNVIDVHISRLRKKVDRGFERALIHTVHGDGYSLTLIRPQKLPNPGLAAHWRVSREPGGSAGPGNA